MTRVQSAGVARSRVQDLALVVRYFSVLGFALLGIVLLGLLVCNGALAQALGLSCDRHSAVYAIEHGSEGLSLVQLDLASAKVQHRVPFGAVDTVFDGGFFFSPSLGVLFVAGMSGTESVLAQVNPATGAVVSRFALDGAPVAWSPDPQLGVAWSVRSMGSRWQVVRTDLMTGSQIPVSTFPSAVRQVDGHFRAYDPVGRRWVFFGSERGGAPLMVLVDGMTGSVLEHRRPELPPGVESLGGVTELGRDAAFVMVEHRGRPMALELDLVTGKSLPFRMGAPLVHMELNGVFVPHERSLYHPLAVDSKWSVTNVALHTTTPLHHGEVEPIATTLACNH